MAATLSDVFAEEAVGVPCIFGPPGFTDGDVGVVVAGVVELPQAANANASTMINNRANRFTISTPS